MIAQDEVLGKQSSNEMLALKGCALWRNASAPLQGFIEQRAIVTQGYALGFRSAPLQGGTVRRY